LLKKSKATRQVNRVHLETNFGYEMFRSRQTQFLLKIYRCQFFFFLGLGGQISGDGSKKFPSEPNILNENSSFYQQVS
jgi:hypothetical protein